MVLLFRTKPSLGSPVRLQARSRRLTVALGFVRFWRTCGALAAFAATFYLHKSQRSNAPLRQLSRRSRGQMHAYTEQAELTIIFVYGIISCELLRLRVEILMSADKQNKIYIVLSNNHTSVGRIVCLRQKLQFGRKDIGARYSHASLSLDATLQNMLSFARKRIHNPFVAGLVQESITSGLFALKPTQSRIAVICLDVSSEQYDKLAARMNEYWNKRSEYKYNTHVLIRILLHGRDKKRYEDKKSFFCSQWVEDILRECGIDIFADEELYTVSPADFYHKLSDYIIYEGLTKEYSGDARTENT